MKDFYLEFLTRPGCHLCRDALPVVRRVARLLAGAVVEIDVETDDDLIVEFAVRIPVVRDPAGVVLAEGRIAWASLFRAALTSRLRAWSRAGRRR